MITNELALSNHVEKTESVFLNIVCNRSEEKLIAPNINQLTDIKNCLNNILPDAECTDVMYTLNTDKEFFGIKVNPIINPSDALTIILTDERVKLNKYQIEFDSKLFSIGLTEEEIVAILLHEVSSMIDSYEAIDNVRALVDLHLLSGKDIISIRDSVNYSQLIVFAVKDTLTKVSSAIYKEEPEELLVNKLIQATNLGESLISAQEKIISSSYGLGETVREPKTIILQWMFMIYKDIKGNYDLITTNLKDAKDFTASVLEKIEIDKVITAINRINSTILENCKLGTVFESANLYSLNELSLFKSLKSNGLRGIEDALYEYAIRIKNCDTEEDAMYILRGINTRLNILEDYMINTPDLSDHEKKHWTDVANKYRELRTQLANKKIVNKKQYGLFFDYDQLDYLDKQ